jgi:hypothetical protein
VNGDLTELVVPMRGIGRGDPIIPCLFILCTEGLSCLLQKVQGALRGLKNGWLGPAISHVLFAEESILFARSDRRNVDAPHHTLNPYCEGLGQ